MNIILIIFVVIVIILIYLVNKKTERFVPDLSSLITDSRKNTRKNFNVLMNIDNICQNGLTDTHIFQGRNHYFLKNGKPVSKIYIKDKIEIPESWSGIDLLAKHTNNRLFVIKDTKVFFVDDFNTTYELSDLYPNIKSLKYKGIIQLNGDTLFFYDDKIITYNNTNNTYSTNNLYTGIPEDYSRVFEWYLEPTKDKPLPILIFIRNGHYFRYNLNTNSIINTVGLKFNGFFPVKKGLMEFTTLGNKGLFGPRSNDILKTALDVTIKDGVQKIEITEKQAGNYRMEVVGAGQDNGGFGARIFTDLTLNSGDNLEIAVGQSGLRLPSQETHNESVTNNLNVLASSSGSGATIVKLNNKPIAIAGGGGGFSSGLLNPPPNCNGSVTDIVSKSIISIPIKKIVFQTPPKMFTIENNDIEYTKRYGTEYIFSQPIIYYTINYTQSKENNVILIDANDNKIVIDKNITRLTPQVVLIQALKFTPLSLRNSTEPVKNLFCKEGNSLLTSNNLNKTGSMEKIPGNVILYGGFNGGGVSSMNIKTAIPHCGGGGGAKGGNSALNSFSLDNMGNEHVIKSTDDNNIVIDNKNKVHIPVTAGSGGSSFIDSPFETSNFNSGFNSKHGTVLLIKHEEYHNSDIVPEEEENDISLQHQMRSKNYLLSSYKGEINKNRIVNKIQLDRDYNFNQLRVKILFNLDDVTTEQLSKSTVETKIKIQPVFYVVHKQQLLRYDLPNDNALLDTIRPINILHNVPFNEELQKDTNKLSKILTDNLLGGEISYTGKVDINNETLDYQNFYHIKDNTDLAPTELYFIMETPITGVSYNMITIQCNNESMGQYDYLFNKILKKSD